MRDFVIGPQLATGDYYDTTLVTKARLHGEACPAEPPPKPLRANFATDAEFNAAVSAWANGPLDKFINLHYYDLPLSVYTAHRRTGDPTLLALAEKCAESWWKHPTWIGEGRIRLWPDNAAPPPRHAGIGGLIIRALDGRPEMWDWINSYVTYFFQIYIKRRLVRQADGTMKMGPIYDLREGAFMLRYATWLAKCLPDTFPLTAGGVATNGAVLRAQHLADVEKFAVEYFGGNQRSDGAWVWNDAFVDNDGGTLVGVTQPFMVGLLLRALCDAHQVVTSDAAKANIKTQILNGCRHLYANGPYTRILAVNFNVPARGFHYFYHGGTTVNPTRYVKGSTLEPWLTTERWHVESNRQAISTVVGSFAYAYRISGDSFFKLAGDELQDSAYSGRDGFRAMMSDTPKNFNQHVWGSSSYKAWAGGAVVVEPLPVPVPPPPPPPPPTPSPDGTKAVTVTDSTGGVWTLGSEKQTLRNGVHAAGGFGTMYKWLGGKVYVLGTNGWWYLFTGSSWQSVSQQEPGTAPPTRILPWPKQQGQMNALLDAQRAERFYLRRVDGNSATFEKVL